MRLIESTTLELHEFDGKNIPDYAILSHRWEGEEVSFSDHTTGRGKHLKGWSKIVECCILAAIDGIKYVWIDTCCIDKSSSSELQEAINSMYRWYERSCICYAFLSDVSYSENDQDAWRKAFKESKWFTRGWTLQELLAPSKVSFYDRDWRGIGTRDGLIEDILSVTGISSSDFVTPKRASVAKRMSWASKRETTRAEDKAYCLLGLFGVNMPMLYGEGEGAFMRLQLEIIKQTDDESIFAWMRDGAPSGLLADSPADFEKSHDVNRHQHFYRSPYEMTNKGLSISVAMDPVYPDGAQGVEFFQVPLNCSRTGSKDPLHIYLSQHHGINVENWANDPDVLQARRLGRLATSYGVTFPGSMGRKNKAKANPIYVRQGDDDSWSRPYLFSGFHQSYRHPENRNTRTARTKPPDPIWRIDDVKLDEERLLLGLQIYRLCPASFNPSDIADEVAQRLTDRLSQVKSHPQLAQMMGLDAEDTLETLQRLYNNQQAKKKELPLLSKSTQDA